MESSRLDERELFERCLEIPDDQRESVLGSVSARDAELAERVRRLLRAHEAALLDDSVAAASLLGALDSDPEQIGPYRVIRRIGHGGMGVVYLAEQLEPIRRTVAVKIIKLGLAFDEVIHRFVAERQALALMTHPNIARILDAGATEDGRPYFVMEYVRGGQPITLYSDAHNLSLRRRLKLFRSVCRAAQHAHENGVLHRDLKPSNILVTEEDGVPSAKVIDFGVAKALFEPLTAREPETHAGGVIGTPAYMSPEQRAAGTRLDARADIYSLGMVLLELVTGVRVGDEPESGAPPDRPAEAPLPSALFQSLDRSRAALVAAARRTTPSRLLRELRGDLDWIVARALEVDPDRRYPSAAALAHDLDLLLSHRPVTAAPQRLLYRMRKAATRHRTGFVAAVAAASLVALLFLEASRLTVLGPDESSIVVLPLSEIGDDIEPLAIGLHESLITELAQLTDVEVIARGSTIELQRSGLSPAAIGRDLGVGSVLEGTVQRVADRIRVTVRLYRSRDDVQIWSEQYDRPYRVDGVLDLQRDIADQVARALSTALLPRRPAPTGNMDALVSFYAGNAHYTLRYEREETDHAIRYYEEAIEQDPGFGEAFGALARAYIWRFWQFSVGPDRVPAQAALERARVLAPDAVETRLAEGFVMYRLHRDFEAALDFFLAADRQAPGNASLQEAIGYAHRRLGHWDEAVARLELAARLEPRRPGLLFSIGHTHHMMRSYGRAAEWYDRLTLQAPRPGPNGPFEARADLYSSLGDTAAIRSMVDEVPSDAAELRASLLTTLAYYGRRYDDALAEGGRLRIWPFSREMDTEVSRALLSHLAGRVAQRDSMAARVRANAEAALQELAPEEINARARAYGALALAHAVGGSSEQALRAARASRATLSLEVDAYSGRYGEQRLAAVSLLVGNDAEAIELLAELLSVPNELTPELLALDPRADAVRERLLSAVASRGSSGGP